MPRSTVAIQMLREAGLPFVVVLTHPTTGGLLDHGMLDRVTHRSKIRDELATILRILMKKEPRVIGDLPAPSKVDTEEPEKPKEAAE